MISPQMSAWVRVWAWGSWRGGLSFYLGSPAALRAGCGARGAAEVPGGGGGSAAAAAPPGAPPDSGRGLRMGSGGAPRKNSNTQTQTNKQQQNKITRKRGRNGKVLGGGAAGKALPAAGTAAARGRSRGESLQRGGHRGDPRGHPRARHRAKLSQLRGRAAPRPGGGRSERR